jgi:hypothetical protein
VTRMSTDCNVTIIGAGPYGLSAAAYLRAAGIEARIFGEPMAFWEKQMPAGMCLRSNWGASHIADPSGQLTLDTYCLQNGNHVPKPIPLSRFLDYGHWFQQRVASDLERTYVQGIEIDHQRFRVTLSDEQSFTSKRVVVAAGISSFATRPAEFAAIPPMLASHSSEHNNLAKFSNRKIVVIGAGQSALESAALCKEAGAEVEVIVRKPTLNWVGLHPRLHHLGLVSKALYSNRDVGPAGISRLVAMPYLFRQLPRRAQDRIAYRAIRPAVAGWLRSRLIDIPISFGRRTVSACPASNQLLLRLDDGSERRVDHALLATGFRVDVSQYKFLSESIVKQLEIARGYPVLKQGLESSICGLHFVGKPAAYSFGPLLGFVSGTEFSSNELVRAIAS